MSSSEASSSDSELPVVPPAKIAKPQKAAKRSKPSPSKSKSKSKPVPDADTSSASEDSDSDASSASEDSDSDDAESEAEDGDEDKVEDEEDDTPVLSHAERRRQKRKEKEEASAGAADKTKAKKKSVKNSAEIAPSKAPKRKNSIWVGNLSFKTTAEALKKFFDGCGEITRVHMPLKVAAGPVMRGNVVKENRGLVFVYERSSVQIIPTNINFVPPPDDRFAYVDFETADQKAVAIALSEGHLDGRRLLIKDGDDFEGRPSTSAAATEEKANAATATKTAQKILRVQKQPPGPTLFFGNLGFETTDQSLKELLTRNHTRPNAPKKKDDDETPVEHVKEKWLRKIRMGTFEDTGKCKGWAFVDFHRTEDATEALVNMRNHYLDGRDLKVEYGSPDAVRRGGAGPRPERTGDHKFKGKGKDDVRPKRKAAGEGDVDGDVAMDGGDAEGAKTFAAKRRRTDGDEETGECKPRYSSRPMKARPKPGAALALAKREDASIVPSQGKKIVF
ncbi:hypothetical protein EUX98_g1464 [Antrodiella citrinella]|uniref:RRM domain-containing protein n=1 Tax=Antrodiella citrinella TaxID=2447956 RepID=A0A4S4N9X8_9APHY|nr:hypothetical protein EUX98_g1464 [Antrodiella citrinella]